MTYQQWNERACRLANALRGLGLERGDRLAVLAYNRLEWVEIYAAAAKAGLVAVPIHFRLTGPEAQYIFSDCGARALIAEAKLLAAAESIREQTQLDARRFIAITDQSQCPGWNSYEKLLLQGRPSEPSVTVNADDPWCLMYTSGTTGNPKGAIRSHRAAAMLSLATGIELRLERRDQALLVMPMCHANSLYFFSAFAYCGGAVSIYSRPNFDPVLCLRTLAGTGATFTSMVPTHYSMLLDVPPQERQAYDFEKIEKLMISSAPARADAKREIMEMFGRSDLFELYGSTEAGWVTMLHPHEQLKYAGTVGREVVGSEPIRMLDEQGNEVPDGQPGELYSSSPYGFDGYWNLPEKTQEAFRGSYLTVGDLAARDADGFIRLIDRKNNLIISGGENIYPSEVETVLASHAKVRDTAVVGQPDARWGERVCAFVVPNPGCQISESELQEWSRNRLAGYKQPRRFIFLQDAEMPRNATGKILHRALRERLKADAAGTIC